MASPVLHGAVNIWDELSSLALPFFVTLTLWLLSRKPPTHEDDPADDHPHHAEEEGPSMSRRVWLLLVLVAMLAPSTVSAHTELIRSDPAEGATLPTAPGQVRLYFSEPIEPDFFTLEVYAADGARVDQGNARVPADDAAGLEADLRPLPQGTYVVAWRVVSIDSHVVQGTFAFAIGSGSVPAMAFVVPERGAPFALDAAARWLTFLLAFVLIGSIAFLPLVFWPAAAAAGIADAPARQIERATVWVAWVTLVALLGVSLGALVLQTADVSGAALSDVFQGEALSQLLVGTKYGALWIARMAALVALLGVVGWASVAMRFRRSTAWAAVAVGAGLLALIAATGHASAVPRRAALTVAVDWVHLVAGAVWTGGLLQVLLVVPVARRIADADQRRRLLAHLVQRFSWTAALSVMLLALTGLYAGLVYVPTLRSLGYTDYGAALSGKVLLVVPLLMLGGVNLLLMHPRFIDLARGEGTEREASTHRWFSRIVRGEVMLVALVLAVTGILTGLPPATSSPGSGTPYSATQRAADIRVTFTTTPNQAGANRIEVTLMDAAGQPVVLPRLTVALEHQDMVMEARQATLTSVGDGRYGVEGTYLNMAGRWNGTVLLPDGVTTTFQWTVGDPAGRAPAFSPALIAVNALTPLAGVAVLAVVLAALVYRTRARDRKQAAWIGGMLLLLGLLATGNTLATAYRRTLPNPVPATAENIARGRQIYVQNCATCHGLTGRGDGPAGARLDPRPADLQLHMREGHADPELFRWIRDGVDGTGMPAFGTRLTEDEIWTVVNFLHTLGGTP